MISEDHIKKALGGVNYPGFSRDIISFGLVKGIELDGDNVRVKISLATRDEKVPQAIYRNAMLALEAVDGIGKIDLDFDITEPAQPEGAAAGNAAGLGKSAIPGVKKIIAVASGKGGVGKSTVATNLAIALAKTGANVGLCDCDLYGPSVANMLGNANKQPMATEQNQIIPLEAHGIKSISMGNLLEDDSPVIVRGPLATRYTQQFLRETQWGDLDFLILDLPPGTGDIQLTIVQTIAVDGAVIVTTPQEIALIDARKAVGMFKKVNVPILGIVENMAWFECDLGTRYAIFGEGGGKAEAEKLGVQLLGQIPIDPETGARGDNGEPVATLDPAENKISAAFAEVASKM